MKIKELEELLKECYSKKTCYPECRNEWNKNNKTLGHCAIVSLIVNDCFGGDIYKCIVNDIIHYYNVIDDEIIDLTKEQFGKIKLDYSDSKKKERNRILENLDTKERYEILKEKLELLIVDKEIAACYLCSNLIEKFTNDKSISFGKNKDILILGEAPANNGWRKSGVAWYDTNNKLLPSGVVMQKLLSTIDVKLEDTYFLEAIKCYPKNRNCLNICSKNCHKYLFKQLDIIKPKLILSLGNYATKSILDIKYSKFSDVVGKEFNVNGFKVIPIYHPSPISPLSYKGNIDIFEKLKLECFNKKEVD